MADVLDRDMDLDAAIPGIDFAAFDPADRPMGFDFRVKLKPWPGGRVVATGIPTGTGPTVSVTDGFDTDKDGPDSDPGGGDPPSGMI